MILDKGSYMKMLRKNITTVIRNDTSAFTDDIDSKLVELKKDLFQLRLQHATNQLDNPVRIAEVKKDIARVKTMIREQQLAGR